VSLLRVSRDRDGGLNVAGRGWQEDGTLSVRYWSEATKEHRDPSSVFYYWKGWKHLNPNDSFEGIGEVVFDDAMNEASGFYSDANLGDMKTATIRRILMRRVTPKEEQSIKAGPQALAPLIQALRVEYALVAGS